MWVKNIADTIKNKNSTKNNQHQKSQNFQNYQNGNGGHKGTNQNQQQNLSRVLLVFHCQSCLAQKID